MKKDFAIPAGDLINNWVKQVMSDSSLTEADTEELKTHLLDIMDELIEAGLDEEEAFIIASRRIGTIDDIEDEYRQENMEVIQTRRTAVVLSGVLIYFFSYHFVGALTKLLFIVLFTNNVTPNQSMIWMNRFLITCYFIIMLFFSSIMLFENKVVGFIEKIKIRPNHAIQWLVATLIVGITSISLMEVAKNVIGINYGLRGKFLHTLIYYDYSFPFLFCLGFILIYYRYYRKVRI